MGICVCVPVGAAVLVGRGARVSVSVEVGAKVSVPCGDDMEGMLVDVEADFGEGEAGFPAELHAEVVMIKTVSIYRVLFFIPRLYPKSC